MCTNVHPEELFEINFVLHFFFFRKKIDWRTFLQKKKKITNHVLNLFSSKRNVTFFHAINLSG